MCLRENMEGIESLYDRDCAASSFKYCMINGFFKKWEGNIMYNYYRCI